MKRILSFLLLAAATAAHAQISVGSATPRSGGGNSVFPDTPYLPGLFQTRNGESATGRRELGPVMGFVTGSYTSPIDGVTSTWSARDTWTYTGEMYMTAGISYTFAARIDDESTLFIDGRSILNQRGCNFASATYSCTETGWHSIVITLGDPGGGQQGVCGGFTPGVAYNTTGQTAQTPLSGWTRLVDSGNGSLLRTKGASIRVTAQMRETDPTVMDVDYIVYTDPATTPMVNVRVLAFENGERGFATVVRPETFIEGTDENLGDGIAANVAHRLSWKVSSDWATDLANVSFEVMAMKPGDLLLSGMHFVTIPAADGHPKTIVSVNDLRTDAYLITAHPYSHNGIYQKWWVSGCMMKGHTPLLDSLLWLYADEEEDLLLAEGVLSCRSTKLVRHAAFEASDSLYAYWSLSSNAIQYIFDKMGYRLLVDATELAWVNKNTRLNLQPQQFRQYAVKCDSNNNVEMSKPGLWQTALGGQGAIDQTLNIDEYWVHRVLGPVMAFTGDSYTNSASGNTWTWSENTVFVYRGKMRMEAGTTYTFGSNIDDWCLIKIDGREVIRNVSTSFSSGSYACSQTGWHDIEIRVGNNGGAGGAGGSSGWKTNVGIGYNTSGRTSENNGNGWTRLVDPGDGSLLRTTGVIPKYVVFDQE